MSLKLQTLCPEIDPAVLAALHALGIRTAHNLLTADSPLSIYYALDPSLGLSLDDIEELVTNVALKISNSGVFENFSSAAQSLQPLLTGVDSLDALLSGLVEGDILELVGPRAVGKTILAMSIVAHELASSRDSSVLWLDTNLNFNTRRFCRILKSHCSESVDETIPNRLHVADCHSAFTAHDILDAAANSEFPRLRLIVVNSITDLLLPAPPVGGKHTHAPPAATSILRRLAVLGRSLRLRVIVLNTATVPLDSRLKNTSVSAFHGTKVVPGLRSTLAKSTSASLWLGKLHHAFAEEANGQHQRNDLLVAELLRSKVSTAGRWCIVRLVDRLRFQDVRQSELLGFQSNEVSP